MSMGKQCSCGTYKSPVDGECPECGRLVTPETEVSISKRPRLATEEEKAEIRQRKQEIDDMSLEQLLQRFNERGEGARADNQNLHGNRR